MFLLSVVLPTGDQETIAVGDTAADVALPLGFIAISLNITTLNISTRNYSLTIAIIMNASLLNGGATGCNGGYISNVVMARCPLASMFSLVLVSVLYII